MSDPNITEEPEPVGSSQIVRQTVEAFRKRADTWERDQGDLGQIVASELRTVIDAFEVLSLPNDQAHAPATKTHEYE